MERMKPHNGHYLFFLSNYGNNGGKEGRLWHNVGRKPHYMAIYFAEPQLFYSLILKWSFRKMSQYDFINFMFCYLIKPPLIHFKVENLKNPIVGFDDK